MALKCSKTANRKPRSDAQRNRERILEVAKEAFTRSGATASLDEIAKQADVGPETLYRHFPTRDELLEAVYRTEVEKFGCCGADVRGNHASNRSAASMDAIVR
jgi:AcrR family transcriptional regulator